MSYINADNIFFVFFVLVRTAENTWKSILVTGELFANVNPILFSCLSHACVPFLLPSPFPQGLHQSKRLISTSNGDLFSHFLKTY